MTPGQSSPDARAPPVSKSPSRRRLGLILAALLGGVAAFAVADSESLGERAMQILAAMGGSYRVQYEARLPDEALIGRTEYLMVLRDEDQRAASLAYIESHPDIEYLSESIYPRTLRVSLPVPVGALPDEIETQPFVRFVVKNLPIFFCH